MVINNYKPFNTPKKASYSKTGDEYIKDSDTGLMGWQQIEEEVTVIGEDDTCYIYKLQEHKLCDSDEPEYGKLVLLPIGFHKSRLIEWLPGLQLELF